MKFWRFILFELKYQVRLLLTLAAFVLIYNLGEMYGFWKSIGFFENSNLRMIFVMMGPTINMVSQLEREQRPAMQALLPISTRTSALTRLIIYLAAIIMMITFDIASRLLLNIEVNYNWNVFFFIGIYFLMGGGIMLYSDIRRIKPDLRYRDLKISLLLITPLAILIGFGAIFRLKWLILSILPLFSIIYLLLSLISYPKRKSFVK